MDHLFSDLSGVGLFYLYRRALVVFCSIYAAVRCAQTAWRWFVFLTFPDRSRRLLKSYLFVQALRVRWRRFWPDYVHIAMLVSIMVLVLYLHRFITPVGS